MSTQGKRLKEIRQALRLSQEEFGAIFDIKKQFVSNIEKDYDYWKASVERLEIAQAQLRLF